MGRSRRIAALAAITALSLSACASNDASPSDVRDVVEEAGLDRDQAACVERRFEDEFTQDQLNDIAGADNLDDLDDQQLADSVRAILEECTTGSTTTGSTEGSGGSGSSSTTEGSGEPSDSTTTTAG
jgi:hypothetical protein